MEVSIFLAKAFSIYFLVVGLAMIIRHKKMKEVIDAFFKNKGGIFLAAIITLILGILLVLFHPRFTADWCVVITVLAWLTLLKGVVYMFVPEFIMYTKKGILSHAGVFYVAGIVCLILAGFLGYHGFII